MTRVIFAGGGTAGHVEPALAVARAWQKAHLDSEIGFLGTHSGLEATLIPAAGFQISYIPKVAVPRRISPKLLILPYSLIKSIRESMNALSGSDLVVGFGGYVSAPAYLAAALLRIPFVIHEANAKPGIANRLGALLTPYCAVSHHITSGTLKKSRLTGLPLKENIVQSFFSAQKDWNSARAQAKRSLGFSDSSPLIFIFGGSQGSEAINRVIAQVQGSLTQRGINILHGVGAHNVSPQSSERYKALNYISDMATAYLAADLVISRSGAVTCAEVNSLGRYALFIPLPIGNGEQQLNASSLIAQGRAETLSQPNFNQNWLLENIERLLLKSSEAPVSGSPLDIEAAAKIVEIMHTALSGGR